MKNATYYIFSIVLLLCVFTPLTSLASISFESYNSLGEGSSLSGPSVTGENTVGIIFAVGDYNTSDNISTISWGADPMTKVYGYAGTDNGGTFRAYSLWYVVNPTSSATITSNGGSYFELHSLVYGGVDQADPIDSSSHDTSSSASSLSLNTTVVSENSWLLAGLVENGAGNIGYTTDVGTVRLNPSGGAQVIADSNGTVSTGSQAIQFTRDSGTTSMNGIIVSLTPYTAPVSASSTIGTELSGDEKRFMYMVIVFILALSTMGTYFGIIKTK